MPKQYILSIFIPKNNNQMTYSCLSLASLCCNLKKQQLHLFLHHHFSEHLGSDKSLIERLLISSREGTSSVRIKISSQPTCFSFSKFLPIKVWLHTNQIYSTFVDKGVSYRYGYHDNRGSRQGGHYFHRIVWLR